MSKYVQSLDSYIVESNGFKRMVSKIGDKIGDVFASVMKSPIAEFLKLRKKNRAPSGVRLLLPEDPIVNSYEPKRKYTSSQLEKILVKFNEDSRLNEDVARSLQLSHPNTQILNVDNEKLEVFLRKTIKYKDEFPLMIWGAPGLGKTSIVQGLTKKLNLPLYDISMSLLLPEDMGLQASKDGRAIFEPTLWLPLYKIGTKDGDKQANTFISEDGTNHGDIGGVIFLDEMPRASTVVQNIWLKLLFDRRLNDWMLGSKWTIIIAGNREADDDDGAGNNFKFGKALGNRVKHVNFVPTPDQWSDWAMTAKHAETGQFIVDPAFISFLKAHSDYFYQLDPDSNTEIFPSPRTWVAASISMLNTIRDAKEEGRKPTAEEIKDQIQSLVGEAPAKKFMEFILLIDKFPLDQISKVYSDPMNAPLPPKQPGANGVSAFVMDETYALLTTVVMSKREQKLTPKELENFMTYVNRLSDSTWANRLVAHIAEIQPKIKDPKTELGAKMRELALEFTLKYPGFKPYKLSTAEIAAEQARNNSKP